LAASPSGQPKPPAASAPAPVAVSPGRLSGPFWGVTTVFVLVLAAVGYGWKGSPQAVGTPPPGFEQAQGGGAPGAPQRAGAEQLDALVKQLTERLEKSPGDIEGWSLLARSQMTLGRYAEAAAAYQKAMAIKPEDPGLLTDYADALGVVNGRTLEGEPARLLERALKLDPRHIKALVLVGTLEFQRGNYAAAQKRWQEVVNIGPAGDGLVELAREGVAQAQARQGKPAPTAVAPAAPAAQANQAPAGGAAPGATAAAAGPGITGTVRLSAALKAQAAPGDVVFIFARAASGGGMPLAILQKRVSDLPATFTLDDTLAMSPAARLSSAQQVVVTARVSKSGQATPQSGDLEGTSPPVAPGARDLVVEIANVRR
jgi:cytochrome c-type biogenesis protein CcmH